MDQVAAALVVKVAMAETEEFLEAVVAQDLPGLVVVAVVLAAANVLREPCGE